MVTRMKGIAMARVAGVLAALVGWNCCLAQPAELTAARTAFGSAIEGQRQVLAELARILKEEKVMLSDGAVQAALESLLKDESKQKNGIAALGRQTLGKKPEELTDQDRATRDRLADNQDIYSNRYRRLEKGMETKAAARPDSIFTGLLMIAEEAQLREQFVEASELTRGNQLGRAMRVTDEIVATLQRMVNAVSQRSGMNDDEKGPGALGFNAPSLLYKAPGERLAEFNWSGAQVESLAVIMRAIRLMEQLVERQRKVADQTKARAARASRDQTADDLAKEEWEIRYLALEVGTELKLLDPEVDRLIRVAAGTIERAIPGMEKGPLSDAIEPAELAVEQLQAAHVRLRATWKDILARLKKYTMEAEHVMGAGGGIPHGASRESMERTKKFIFMMLRATGALTRAMERETDLIEQTDAAETDSALPALKPEQDSLASFVTGEVIPFNIASEDLPKHLMAKLSNKLAPSAELLDDAVDRMQRASAALENQDKPESLKRQNESVEVMTDALKLMVNVLQRLLGQYAQQALAAGGGGSSSFATDPATGKGKASGYLFGLPSEKRESVRQAFRGSFPQRYDRAIKLYYQAIAQEETSAGTP